MNLEATIRALHDEGVSFVVIGGVAMFLHGSAHATKDIDFCYERSQANAERLARAMAPFLYVLPELEALEELKRKTGID